MTSNNKTDDTFTIGEMREAYNKMMRGEKLTEKERELAEARACAVRSCMQPFCCDEEDE